MLAASLRLRFPVPATFPTPWKARDRLFSRIAEVRAEAMSKGELSDENFTLCYAYSNTSSGRPNVALMAGQLATALEASAGVLQGLFGIEVDEELEIDIR